ncbi:MAG TPA: hypothetical protein VK509_22885 [Polyangiales bacterium]|nr:hypothetical protein [Polyangiales bacterium]
MTFFERPLPIALIFGSFFVVFLPLWLLQWLPNFVAVVPYLALAHAVGLGTSHFFVTLAVYVSRENRAYFASSARNQLVYFAAPLAILAFFAWAEGSGLRTRDPLLAGYLFGALRFLDFFHVGRQSVGMLQLWKRPVAAALPSWSRRAENAFFVGMAVMQWQTFRVGGSFGTDDSSFTLPSSALFVLFAVIALSYVRAVEKLGAGAGRAPWLALAYFAMQALSAAVAVYDTRFYLAALTLHYVEYHVIMAPRCFGAVPERVPADRPAALLRAHPLAFYAVLLAVVSAFELRNHVSGPLTGSTQYFVHLFDGIFFVHYFIEAFLWKFGTPYYRERLGPLYFGAAPDKAASAPHAPPVLNAPARRASRWAGGGLVGAGALIGVLGLVQLLGGARQVAASVERRVLRPMRVENHLRWGAELLRGSEIDAARTHAQQALRDDPDNKSARQLLEVAARARSQSGGELGAP